jgi:hypothetical protein
VDAALAAGDALREAESYKAAVHKYKDALAKAEGRRAHVADRRSRCEL